MVACQNGASDAYKLSLQYQYLHECHHPGKVYPHIYALNSCGQTIIGLKYFVVLSF
jgi:hypothetical protein